MGFCGHLQKLNKSLVFLILTALLFSFNVLVHAHDGKKPAFMEIVPEQFDDIVDCGNEIMKAEEDANALASNSKSEEKLAIVDKTWTENTKAEEDGKVSITSNTTIRETDTQTLAATCNCKSEEGRSLMIILQILQMFWKPVELLIAFGSCIITTSYTVITKIVGTSFNWVVYKPCAFILGLVSVFYPLYVFCAIAALTGLTIGAIAGGFSELIVGALTAPPHKFEQPDENGDFGGADTEDFELSYAELERRKRIAKFRRRAAAFENLRVRNGGKIPPEIYERINASQQHRLKEQFLQQQEWLHKLTSGRSVSNHVSRNGSGNVSDASKYSAPARYHNVTL
ncbi:hypothetical protein G9A89_007512 [Geosiphon pyriformis]|nr:hypothetical protein G9A89_007512 [Geosiphon pyriformis]